MVLHPISNQRTFSPRWEHRGYCTTADPKTGGSNATVSDQEGDYEMFHVEMSFPYKLMPVVAVIQLGCWGVYAEQAYSFTGDTSQLWYVGFGFLFPGALAVLRKHYVTKVMLVENMSKLRIETSNSLLPITQSRTVALSEVELSAGTAKTLEGRNAEKAWSDPDTHKLMFKVKGDSTNYLLDNHEQSIDPKMFQVIALVLSGRASQRSIKEALRKVRKAKSKRASE